jgi:TetR/AcrR family fatty acid metabolism transcriptional regulator
MGLYQYSGVHTERAVSFGRQFIRRKRSQVPKKDADTQLQPAVPPRASGEKYQRILDAAVAVFAEKGFHVARVADIASRAGVADGTVYLYFKNKEEILMTAINTAFDAFVNQARTELAKIPSPAEKLRRLAFMHLSALGSNRNLAVVFQMELRQSARFLAPFSHDHMVEYLGLVREAIRQGQEQGQFRADLNEKIAANCFFGAIDEMVTSWVLASNEYPLESTADPVANIILLGLGK